MQSLLKTAPEDTTRVITLNNLSSQYYNASEFAKASAMADNAISLSEKLNYPRGKAYALSNLGTIEWGKGDRKKALEYFTESRKIHTALGNKSGIGDILNNIGNLFYTQGDYADAVKYYNQALVLYEEIKYTAGKLRTKNNLGSALTMQGLYTQGLQQYFDIIKALEVTGDKILLALCTRNIGEIYFAMENYGEAIKFYEKALNIYRQEGRIVGIANTYRIMGKYYEKLTRFDEALAHFALSRKTFLESGDSSFIPTIDNNIGRVHLAKGDYEEALTYFRQATAKFERSKLKQSMTDGYINIGEVLYLKAAQVKESTARQPLFAESVASLYKAVALAKEIGAKESLKNAYAVLASAYKAMQEYKIALDYQGLYVALKDSLINNETTRKMEQQRTQYEVEKAIAEEKATQEKQLAEQELRNAREQAEKNARHRLELAEEQLKKEKAIELEKLRFELALAGEEAEREKLLAYQQLENEKKMAAENAIHIQAMADEKTSQQLKDATARSLLEKEKAAKKRRTEGYLAGLIGLGLISFFSIIIIRQRNEKKRALEKAEAAHKMSELELQSLRAQLNPHFMFNSLNAIQDLIVNEKNEKSQLYLARFSKLLRMLLDNASEPFVTVQQELELLELYLSLEKLRIPNLDYTIEKDPAMNVNTRMIPNMMLQPYIENAIWHGLSHKKGERKLHIRVRENGKGTRFEVEDNGIGRKRSAELKQQFRHGHFSRGMQLLSKRFELLSKEYGAEIQTNIQDLENNGESTGTLVRIDVPFSLSENAKLLPYDTYQYN